MRRPKPATPVAHRCAASSVRPTPSSPPTTGLFDAPGVSVVTGAEVRRLGHSGNAVRSVTFRAEGRDHELTGDLFVLGANAIQSPAILERSGLGGGLVGRGLHESYGAGLEVFLEGVENFDGSTIITGLNMASTTGRTGRNTARHWSISRIAGLTGWS